MGYIVVAMENYLAQYGSWVTIIQGVIFVLFVLTFLRGIVAHAGYLPNDLDCCPSRAPVTVLYRWDGSRLIPSGTPPG